MHGPKKGQLSIMYIINEGKRKKKERELCLHRNNRKYKAFNDIAPSIILTKLLLPPNSSLNIPLFFSSVHCEKDSLLEQTLLRLLCSLLQLDLNIWTSMFISALSSISKNSGKLV